jgi:methylmalonyl-CoA/ethylmalonyl-CoA epimerase
MAFKGFHHVAVRVRDLDAAIEQWTTQFGLTVESTGENEALGIRQAWLNMPDGSYFELVSPLNDESPIAKALEKNGEGLHAVSMNVDQADQVRAAFTEKGVSFAGPFVHPKSSNGVLIGLTEN